MARLPRLTLPGHAHHLILRGNNGQPIVIDRGDRERLLELLGEQAAAHQVALHAYVLTDSRLQLLATPATVEGVPRWMQAVGRAYVRYFNDRHGRSGTLWEGRYRSTLVQEDRHLLTCMAYLDLIPVHEGLAATPAEYEWSSHRHYAGLQMMRWLSPHALCWKLGNTPFDREAAYAAFVREGVSTALVAEITNRTLHGWPVGDAVYLDALQGRAERRVRKAQPGRKPKAAA